MTAGVVKDLSVRAVWLVCMQMFRFFSFFLFPPDCEKLWHVVIIDCCKRDFPFDDEGRCLMFRSMLLAAEVASPRNPTHDLCCRSYLWWKGWMVLRLSVAVWVVESWFMEMEIEWIWICEFQCLRAMYWVKDNFPHFNLNLYFRNTIIILNLL